jgi:hypothetical protein
MPAPKIEPNGSPDDIDASDEASTESKKQVNNQRRLADSINSKGRKLKLDRRLDQNDRRMDKSSDYKGPSRRKTIDQRENTRDRRDKD